MSPSSGGIHLESAWIHAIQVLLLLLQCMYLLLLLQGGKLAHGRELLLQLRQLSHRHLLQLLHAEILKPVQGHGVDTTTTVRALMSEREGVAARVQTAHWRRRGELGRRRGHAVIEKLRQAAGLPRMHSRHAHGGSTHWNNDIQQTHTATARQ